MVQLLFGSIASSIGEYHSNKMFSRAAKPLILLTPAVLSTVVILFICFVVLVILSISQQSYLDIQFTGTIGNIEQALSSPLVFRLLVKSAIIAFFVTLLSVILAYPIAYYIAFDLRQNKLLWLIVFTLPCWVSYLLRVLSWKVILGYQGLVNTALVNSGAIDQPIGALLYNQNSVVIALTHAWAPFAILPIYVSLEKINRSYLSAAAILVIALLLRS